MRLFYTVAGILIIAFSYTAGEDILLLSGFEKADALKWGAKEKEGEIIWQLSQYNRIYFTDSDKSQGNYALMANRGKYLKSGKSRYNILRRQKIFCCYGGRFSKRFPTDWSGYDRLRLDFKGVKAAGRLRIELEDEICQPCVRRIFSFPAGKWITCEINLAEASKLHTIRLSEKAAEHYGCSVIKGRRFNPARMANITLYLEQMDNGSSVLIDNLRLLKPGAEEKNVLPIIKDSAPFLIPEELTPKKPKPLVMAEPYILKPMKPVRVDISKARKTGYPRVGKLTKYAFAAADKNTILFGFLAGYVHVLRSADGGKTWKGLKGSTKPTQIYHNANAPSHCAAGAGKDLLYVYTDYCAGGSNPSNMFFRHIGYEGQEWNVNGPYLADIDCRHCPEWKVTVFRHPGGRIWAAWMHLNRFGKTYLRARFSDDSGVMWQDTDSNAMVRVNRDNSCGTQQYGITLWLEEPEKRMPPVKNACGIVGKMFHRGFAVSPYKNYVMCIWPRTWQEFLMYSTFDGTKWTEPAKLTVGGKQMKGSAGSAIGAGSDNSIIYAAVSQKKKGNILRFSDNTWTIDNPPGTGGGTLCASNSRIFCLWKKREGQSFTLYYSSKPFNGTWEQPKKIVTELESFDFTVPRKVPDNCMPILWGPNKAWIKYTTLETGSDTSLSD